MGTERRRAVTETETNERMKELRERDKKTSEKEGINGESAKMRSTPAERHNTLIITYSLQRVSVNILRYFEQLQQIS